MASYQLDSNFTYHAPRADMHHQERYQRIRDLAKQLATFIVQGDGLVEGVPVLYGCPESRERSLALTKLEEAVMWANASIARNEQEPH